MAFSFKPPLSKWHQPVLTEPTKRLHALLVKAITEGSVRNVERLLRMKPDLNLESPVLLVKGLDDYWFIETAFTQKWRKGLELPKRQHLASLLEVALLVPQPHFEIIKALVVAGAFINGCVIERVVQLLERRHHVSYRIARGSCPDLAPRAYGIQESLNVVKCLDSAGADWVNTLIGEHRLSFPSTTRQASVIIREVQEARGQPMIRLVELPEQEELMHPKTPMEKTFPMMTALVKKWPISAHKKPTV